MMPLSAEEDDHGINEQEETTNNDAMMIRIS